MSRPHSFDRHGLIAREMSFEHLDGLLALSASVGWPHRKDDWSANIATGRGLVAVDELGRVHGSAMYFRPSKEVSAIGMVIAHPRLRLSGIGEWLLSNVTERAFEQPSFLNACDEDIGFYHSLGARVDGRVFQHQGIVNPTNVVTRHCRLATMEDLADILAFDAEASGVDRSALLLEIARMSAVMVVTRSGRVAGFAMRRPFGRGYRIGPIAASGERDAICLVDGFLRGLVGRFVRIDTQVPDGEFRRFLEARGLRPAKGVAHMTVGKPATARTGKLFGLCSHSTG